MEIQTIQVAPVNPFACLAVKHSRAAKDCAIALSVAHSVSDVWAACRTLDRVRMVSGGTTASYLNGRFFAAWVDADDCDIPGLEWLRELAHEYLDALAEEV